MSTNDYLVKKNIIYRHYLWTFLVLFWAGGLMFVNKLMKLVCDINHYKNILQN